MISRLLAGLSCADTKEAESINNQSNATTVKFINLIRFTSPPIGEIAVQILLALKASSVMNFRCISSQRTKRARVRTSTIVEHKVTSFRYHMYAMPTPVNNWFSEPRSSTIGLSAAWLSNREYRTPALVTQERLK